MFSWWTQRIKTPTQSGLIHTLYQLNTLPFLQTLERAPRDHGKRTFCGACYHLGHYKKDCPFYQCPHCLLTQPCCNEDQCLDNPIYSGPTAIKQESPSPPPLQVPPLKTVKKPYFPPNFQNSNSSSLSKSSNRINKRGWKGKKPEWKKFQENINRSLVREFKEMDQKSDQELKTFSTDTSYYEEYNEEAVDNINDEPSHFHNF